MHHDLRVRFLLKEERIEAESRLTIKNDSGEELKQVPFLLYRLLKVTSVFDEKLEPLQFSQSLEKFDEIPAWEVAVIRVNLPVPLSPGKSTTICLNYEGAINGYPEVMEYTKDRIDETYALMRQDVLGYPELGRPVWKEYIAHAVQARFTYNISATVPRGYIVATGGAMGKTIIGKDSITYSFSDKGLTSRMALAVSKFTLLFDDKTNMSVYCLPADKALGENALREMKRAMAYYASIFGELAQNKGFTLIEIPEGWGSWANNFSIFQTASGFKNISELYHEIAHSWNVEPKQEIQRSRYFDEAFGTYFEALAVKQFNGDSAFQKNMLDLRKSWNGAAEKNKQVFDTPIADYGKNELGRNSYTKGAWSLYVLHTVVGDEAFRKIIRTLLNEHRTKPAGFEDFQRITQEVSKRNLKRYFAEWFYGIESSGLLSGESTIGEIAARY
jgi:hypothetical protein